MPLHSEVTIKNGPLPTMLGSILRDVCSGDRADYHDVVDGMYRQVFADAIERCANRLPPAYLTVDLNGPEPTYSLEVTGIVRNAYVLGLMDGARKQKESVWWRRLLRSLRLTSSKS